LQSVTRFNILVPYQFGEGTMLRSLAFCLAFSGFALLSETGTAATIFNTGSPDGRAAFASRPAGGGNIEVETADDFAFNSPAVINGATFTGLIPLGVPLSSVNFAGVELYRVFPFDSAVPASGNVPTRVNSPSDVAFASRDSTLGGGLTFTVTLLNANFTAANSIVNGINKSPGQFTGGEGAVSGLEVLITITFTNPFFLPQDHYFFKPEAGLTSGTFLWLSTARGGSLPVFPGGTTDLQAWIRNTNLDPDWLRAGADIIGGTTFNAAFTLDGTTIPEPSSMILFLLGGAAALGWKRLKHVG
jgi:PEP-CTERM motif